MAHSSATLGLVIHEVARDRKVLGVLQDAEVRLPFHIVYERLFTCFRHNAGGCSTYLGTRPSTRPTRCWDARRRRPRRHARHGRELRSDLRLTVFSFRS